MHDGCSANVCWGYQLTLIAGAYGRDVPEVESKHKVNWLCFWSPSFMRVEFVIGNLFAYGGVSYVGWGANDLLVLFPFLISRFLWVSLILFPVFPESPSIWISFFLQVVVTSFILPDILSNHCLSCGFHDLGEWCINKVKISKARASVWTLVWGIHTGNDHADIKIHTVHV